MKIFEDKTLIFVSDDENFQEDNMPVVETVVVRYKPEDKNVPFSVPTTILLCRTHIYIPDEAPEWVWDALIKERETVGLPLEEERAWVRARPSMVIREAIRAHDFFAERVQKVFEKKVK